MDLGASGYNTVSLTGVLNLVPRVSGGSETCLCPAIGEAHLWEQRSGSGLNPKTGSTHNALKEFRWSATPKQKGSHVQIHDFKLVPTYDNVICGTICYCTTVYGEVG